jgi:hypothetical protein
MKVEQGPNLPTDQGAPGATTDPPGPAQMAASHQRGGGGLSSRCLHTERPGLAAGGVRGDGHVSYGRGLENAAADLERRRM